MKVPELEKITGLAHDSQLIGEFIEWLGESQSILLMIHKGSCDTDGCDHEVYMPVTGTIEEILAKYFNIDLAKAEKERQGLLAEIRDRKY